MADRTSTTSVGQNGSEGNSACALSVVIAATPAPKNRPTSSSATSSTAGKSRPPTSVMCARNDRSAVSWRRVIASDSPYFSTSPSVNTQMRASRSEERRVGKEWRTGREAEGYWKRKDEGDK